VVRGEQTGLVREVIDAASIGRYDGNDLYLPDAGVAWRHALVRRAEAGFRIEVLPGAEAGALVGAAQVAPGGSAPLAGGERIRLGDAELEFRGR
jgi:pSer/pThr/pTyr-binding forkhead associated (FHA) protein